MTAIHFPPRFAAGFWFTMFLIVFALVGFDVLPAEAHLYLATDGGIYIDKDAQDFTLRLNMNLEAILAGIDPEVRDTSESPNAREYDRLRRLPPNELEKEFDKFRDRFLAGINFQINGRRMSPAIASTTFNEVGDLSKPRKTFVFLKGQLPPDARTFAFGWRPEFGKLLLRTAGARQRSLHVETLERGQMSEVMNIDDIKSRTIWNMVGDFVYLGYTHILPKGLDHILFVVGIFLLSIQVRPILSQVTAFTVAHTITLGLGTAGVVNLPSSIVEPLIAASIVYVAVENILRPTLSPWRPMVVFCFGLLHGLGFAGILKDFGIPRGDFLTGLLSFNIGVELGQLTIIAICFMLVGLWFGNRTWYRAAVVIPGSLVIAAIGGFWFVQRVGLIA